MLVQEVEENRHRIAQLLREKVDVVYNSSTLKERQEILSSGVVAPSRYRPLDFILFYSSKRLTVDTETELPLI